MAMNSSQAEGALSYRHGPALELRSITDILRSYVRRWPVFALALAATGALAYLYLRFTPKAYTIEAVLLIQDTKKIPEDRAALQELKLSNSSKLVENEIEVLTSRQFVEQCVQDLTLNVSYLQPGLIRRDIYATRPVSLKLLRSKITTNTRLKLRVLNDRQFEVTYEHQPLQRCTFNTTYNSEWGQWRLVPTAHLAGWIGQPLELELRPLPMAASYYQQALSATLVNKQSPVIKLALDDVVPERGEAVLNHLIALYNEAAVAEKNRQTQNTLQFLDERLNLLVRELNGFEKKVSRFRSSNGLTDMPSQSKIYLENAQANERQLNEVNIQLNIVDGVTQYLRSRGSAPLSPVSLGIADPTLIGLIDKLAGLQLQREKMLAITPEQSPVFEPLDRQITSTKIAISSTVNNLRSTLTRTRNKLLAYNARNTALLREVPQQERALTDIKRQQTIKENLYLYLLQKREELSLSYVTMLTDARVIDKAYPAHVKWPKASLVYTIALLLGLTLPIAGIYVSRQANSKVKSRREVEDTLQAPVFEELVLGDGGEVSAAGGKYNRILAEQLRCLRTHLNSVHERSSLGRVTLLTSSIAGEGKSFLARNLAITLAAAGRKTVLVELDMHRPTLAKAWHLSDAHRGLEGYLLEESAVEQCVVASGRHELLDAIVCHRPLRNAAEILEQPKVDALLNYLRLVYDDIVIDTPPAQLVADATILARFTDVCLYLVRQGVTPKKVLLELQAYQRAQKFAKLYVVFNAATLDSTRLHQYQYYQTE
jgi:tyrosine-protein kinase Etk/Wzc